MNGPIDEQHFPIFNVQGGFGSSRNIRRATVGRRRNVGDVDVVVDIGHLRPAGVQQQRLRRAQRSGAAVGAPAPQRAQPHVAGRRRGAGRGTPPTPPPHRRRHDHDDADAGRRTQPVRLRHRLAGWRSRRHIRSVSILFRFNSFIIIIDSKSVFNALTMRFYKLSFLFIDITVRLFLLHSICYYANKNYIIIMFIFTLCAFKSI